MKEINWEFDIEEGVELCDHNWSVMGGYGCISGGIKIYTGIKYSCDICGEFKNIKRYFNRDGTEICDEV